MVVWVYCCNRVFFKQTRTLIAANIKYIITGPFSKQTNINWFKFTTPEAGIKTEKLKNLTIWGSDWDGVAIRVLAF